MHGIALLESSASRRRKAGDWLLMTDIIIISGSAFNIFLGLSHISHQPNLIHLFHRLATMAFFMRRPFAIPTALRQVPKTVNNTTRFIHNSPLKPSQPKPSAGPSSVFAKSRQTFQNAFRRTYMQPTYNASQNGNLSQRLLYGAAIVGGTVLVTNLIFNRETREDGGMPAYERSFLNETFMHTGLGIGIIGIAARALHMNGWSFRLMSASPWAVMGLGLVASIGTMYGTLYTSPDK